MALHRSALTERMAPQSAEAVGSWGNTVAGVVDVDSGDLGSTVASADEYCASLVHTSAPRW